MARSPLYSFAAPDAPWGSDRRLAGFAATLLVHAALILGWQMSRTAPPPQEETAGFIQWLRLPAPAPRPEAARIVQPEKVQALRPAPARATRSAPVAIRAVPAPPAASDAAPTPETTAAPAVDTPAMPGATAAAIMESARRSVGSIDRALRKESKPTIIAPPDSPQIRMREGMEQAHALAPGRIWEAPKVEELVNNTGDGARRTRVITGNGTYCITSRSPATGIDMIEMHGREMITSCPKHETPAKKQVWRTARD